MRDLRCNFHAIDSHDVDNLILKKKEKEKMKFPCKRSSDVENLFPKITIRLHSIDNERYEEAPVLADLSEFDR